VAQVVDPRKIPKRVYETKIRELRDAREGLALKDRALASEQAWWQQGLDILLEGAAVGRTIRRPTLREAIVLVLKAEDRSKTWRPAEIIEALGRRGWLPEARSHAQMVRNRLYSMVEKGELRRDGEGNYSIAPDIRNTGLLLVEAD
jgi:hypothetical protein